MGSYEIFSYTINTNITLFAMLCILIAGFFSFQEKNLKSPISFLLWALVFDLSASWVEAWLLKNPTASVNFWVMVELVLLLVSMFFMSFAATSFVSGTSSEISKYSWVIWVLSGLIFISIILFTLIIEDGEIINKLRIILPMTSFTYLAVGLIPRLSWANKNGALILLSLSSIVAISIFLRFFNVYAPWYFTFACYVIIALSITLMYSDELHTRLDIAQKNIDEHNRKIEEIIRLSPFPIVISRLSDDKIVLVNDNALKIFNLSKENINEYGLKDLFADSNNRRVLLEQLEENREIIDFEVLIKSPHVDTPFWLLTSANIIDYNNDVVIYAAFQDITSRKARENILQNQATRDPLTSVYNRRYFETEVAKLIKKNEQNQQPFSILMLDADFFKKVNDTYGHKIGDKVLIELASKTEKALRECDVVARYGGEEFLVFLSDINAEQAYKVAERLRACIANIVVLTETGQKVTFTVSIGVSSSAISNNVDMLIKTADEALYRAKQNGRNRVEVFTPKDLKNFQMQGNTNKSNNEKNIHPIFAAENNAEISLLDGKETQKTREE